MNPLHHLPLALALVLALLAAPPPAAAQAPSAGGELVTLASYNLENFFDVFDDPFTDDQTTEPKPRRELEQIAAALIEVDADVVLLQELENLGALEAFNQELIGQLGYAYVAAPRGNDGRGIGLGVLSRLPVESITSYRLRQLHDEDGRPMINPYDGGPLRMSRDVMHVVLDVPGDRPLHVINVHLKSNRDGPNDPRSVNRRLAEATLVREIVADLLEDDPEAWITVAGDFNSDYMVQPGDERRRPWPTYQRMMGLDGAGGPQMIDPHAELDRPRRISLPSRGEYPDATFDYVILSPALAEHVVPGSAYVLQRADITGGSDHRPVVVELQLPQ